MSKVLEVNLIDQCKKDMTDYALYAIRTRATADVKDGLKCVHRRILYSAAFIDRAVSDSTVTKSAKIVGSTLGRLHPHGDSSVYDAMKCMVNWFEIKEPLIKGDGNWGSFTGASQAAMRYTEAYVTKFAMDNVIGEMTHAKEIVDWVPNFSGSENEPVSLPVKLPLLLINGTFGMCVGVKASIPKHNLGEVIDATIGLIKDPNMDVVLLPEQCMPCELVDTNFKAICNKGNGSYTVRSIIDIIPELTKKDVDSRSNWGKPALLVRSLPDLTFCDTIEKNIESMIEKKQLPQISDILYDNDADKKIMKWFIVLKKGSDPNYVKDLLYKNTDLEKPMYVNFEVLDNDNLVRMSYKSYLLSFIEYRKMTKFRYYCNKMQQVRTKIHEKEAFIKALQSGKIDEIINIVKNQKTIQDNDNIEMLVRMLDITDLQAKYILNASIRELSLGYLNKYIEDGNKLLVEDEMYFNKILNEKLLEEEIIQELIEIKKKYAVPTNRILISKNAINDIPEGDFKVIITENNFVKKVQAGQSMGKFKGDKPKYVIEGSNTENILLFDDLGKVFKLPIHKIPVSDKNSNGIDIRLLIKKFSANICVVMYEPKLIEYSKKIRKHFITILTKNNSIKKLDIEDFLAVPPSGIFYIKLDQGDTVCSVNIILDNLDIIVYSKNKACRMNLTEIPHQKRSTKGVKAINGNDEIDGLSVIYPTTTHVIVITNSGKINKFDILGLPLSGRAKTIGTKVIKLGKTDSIHAILTCNEKDILKVRTRSDVIEYNIQDLPNGSSISSGTKIIPLSNGDNIVYCNIKRK